MKFLALVSGGKDSIFNIKKCIDKGHELVAIANLQAPKNGTELDSYMYQTVGTNVVSLIAEALDVPLYQREITGKPKDQTLEYNTTDKKNDEVEDLFDLIKDVIEKQPEIKGVSSGAIASTYQKNRVENICERLNLVSLAFMWDIPQEELLQSMVDYGLNSVVIKTAAFGLDPDKHLGKSLKELQPHFLKIHKTHGFHVCGEGGEYETLTLDCPLYKKKIKILSYEVVKHDDDPFSPVHYMVIKEAISENK